MTFESLCGIIILAVTTVAKINGEVSEWFKELVLKTSDPERDQGFESLPLRHINHNSDFTINGEVLKW